MHFKDKNKKRTKTRSLSGYHEFSASNAARLKFASHNATFSHLTPPRIAVISTTLRI